MSSPLVTIVTPSFNQARFLAEAIDSVAAQDYASVEHLVFDGGSTDGSRAILEQYGARITAVIGPDGGQAEAVNRGLREAGGEIVGWLNSDDFYYPGAIRSVVDYLDLHPECAVVYGSALYVDENGTPIEPYPTGDPEDLRFGCFICQPAVFFRRRAIEAAGLLDPSLRYCMDYDLWLRMARSFRLHRIENQLAAYRLHGASKSVAEQLAARRETVIVTRRRLGATPLTSLYGYANFLVREWWGLPLDDGAPMGLPQTAAAWALTGALALRYHPIPTGDDVRMVRRRLARGRALAPGDFSPAAPHVRPRPR